MKSISTVIALLALVPTASAEWPKPIAPHLMRIPGSKFLPPDEYDKPYMGKLTIEHAETPEDVGRICNLSRAALACAFAYDGTRCRIVIVPTAFINATGYTEAIVMRHELSHCGGWPADHPGQRPL